MVNPFSSHFFQLQAEPWQLLAPVTQFTKIQLESKLSAGAGIVCLGLGYGMLYLKQAPEGSYYNDAE